MTRALTKNGKVNKNSQVSIIIPCLKLVFKLQSFQTKICTILSTFQEHILSWLYLADLRRVVIRKVPEAVASSRKVRSFYFGHFFSQQLIKFSTNILGRPQYGHEIIHNVVFSNCARHSAFMVEIRVLPHTRCDCPENYLILFIASMYLIFLSQSELYLVFLGTCKQTSV